MTQRTPLPRMLGVFYCILNGGGRPDLYRSGVDRRFEHIGVAGTEAVDVGVGAGGVEG